MELAVTELEALQARLLSLEAEKSNLQGKLEANRQEAASSEVRGGETRARSQAWNSLARH
jgi:hypothetical protein